MNKTASALPILSFLPVLPLLLLLHATALRAEEPVPEPRLRYVLGAAIRYQPEYAGARSNEAKISPLWAVQYGRWHISTSGGSGLLGFGSEVRGDGASTELLRSEKVRFGLSLRVDSGRKSAEASVTEGLPDVKRTLRGRLYASYALSSDWQLAGSLSQDLLGKQGGLVGGLDLGWRLRQAAHSEWTAGVGVSFADATNLRSYFGVTPAGSAASGLRTFEPGAGLRDVHAGMGWTYGFTPRWIAFSSLGASVLMSPVADSPLTQRRLGLHAAIGLAYRN